MFGCECQQQQQGSDKALAFLPRQLEQASSGELFFYVQGVRTGLEIKAAEQAKWQRFSVILALTFGVLTFVKHMNE